MSVPNERQIAERRVTEWFRREQAVREGAVQAPYRAARPVITLSRQFGAGGHTLANRLVASLGEPWEVWDRELIDAIAASAQVRTGMVEALDERAQSWMDEMIHRAFGKDLLEPAAYRKHLAQTVLALAQQGCKIIVGRGANFILHDALNVRLMASEASRLRMVRATDSLSEEEALRKIQQVDRARAEFTANIFDRQIDDPNAYDIVLRSDTLGLDAAVAAIAAAARARFELP